MVIADALSVVKHLVPELCCQNDHTVDLTLNCGLRSQTKWLPIQDIKS